jgi:hypothetical protein
MFMVLAISILALFHSLPDYEVTLFAYFLLWIAWVLDHIVRIYMRASFWETSGLARAILCAIIGLGIRCCQSDGGNTADIPAHEQRHVLDGGWRNTGVLNATSGLVGGWKINGTLLVLNVLPVSMSGFWACANQNHSACVPKMCAAMVIKDP